MGGTPKSSAKSSFLIRSPNTNHPAIGVPPFQETSNSVQKVNSSVWFSVGVYHSAAKIPELGTRAYHFNQFHMIYGCV